MHQYRSTSLGLSANLLTAEEITQLVIVLDILHFELKPHALVQHTQLVVWSEHVVQFAYFLILKHDRIRKDTNLVLIDNYSGVSTRVVGLCQYCIQGLRAIKLLVHETLVHFFVNNPLDQVFCGQYPLNHIPAVAPDLDLRVSHFLW